jgi:hypothetical protein
MTLRRVVLLAVFPAVALGALLAITAGTTKAQGNIDLSGNDWTVKVGGPVTLTCSANVVQNESAISVRMDCPTLGAGDFSGTINQKSGAFSASGELVVPITLSGTAAPDGQSFSGTWDTGIFGGGAFTGTRGPPSTPTPTRVLPTLPAPVDISGTWRVTFTGLFSGECTSVIQQSGTTLTTVAQCDVIGSLDLTGTIDLSTGKLTLGDNGFIQLHGVASADGNSISGTFSALDLVAGDFTAQRDDSIELVDLTGDWHIILAGVTTRDCSMHIEQSALDGTAQLNCPGAPAISLSGTISPLNGFLQLQGGPGNEFFIVGGRSPDGAYLNGSFFEGDNDTGTFFAVPGGSDEAGVLAVDCSDAPGIQQGTCGYGVGDSFTVQVNIVLPPDGGYSGFHVQLAWDRGVLSATSKGILDCGNSSISVGSDHASADCSYGETRTGEPAIVDATLTCDEPGQATLDLSGTTLTDGDGQPVTPILINSGIFCEPGQHGGPGLGDASCNGTTNSIDAALVLQYDAGLLPGDDCLLGADLNFDDRVNSIDASIILQCSAGLTDICR